MRFKRFMSLLLCLIMVMTLMPMELVAGALEATDEIAEEVTADAVTNDAALGPTNSTATVKVVFWGENADNGHYSYLGSLAQTGTVGETFKVTPQVVNDFKEANRRIPNTGSVPDGSGSISSSEICSYVEHTHTGECDVVCKHVHTIGTGSNDNCYGVDWGYDGGNGAGKAAANMVIVS